MWASQYGYESVVWLLLAREDIDTTLCDKWGRDCVDVAKLNTMKQLLIKYRFNKEKQRLMDIGLAFASQQLPIHLLVSIYEQTIEFDDQRVALFDCWEALKLIKRRAD